VIIEIHPPRLKRVAAPFLQMLTSENWQNIWWCCYKSFIAGA